MICDRCVMDTSDPDIAFDDRGYCNHCHRYFKREKQLVIQDEFLRDVNFLHTIAEIKKRGRERKYDCILGVSGGVDSSYACYLAWENGLRTLLVHLDNGWDTQTTRRNLIRLVKASGFDYRLITVNPDLFRDVQLAYLKSGVPDIEVPTDHAIVASIWKQADEHKIKTVLSGRNLHTEGIMPRKWIWNKMDLRNLKAIHTKFGEFKSLNGFPTLSLTKRVWLQFIKGIQWIGILNQIEYNRQKALETLHETFGFQPYGPKHHESLWTRFYQCYILPEKFGIDKRRAHLSTMICSGQITREEALATLEKPPYTPEQHENDFQTVLNHLHLSNEEFSEIMKQSPKKHTDYPSGNWVHQSLRRLWRFMGN